ncbi:hypothetical protein MN086_03125 [Sulfurovum sp. XGS-02]|uniref:hypothetical protein n=1 Tax=Sulfurovum sp. XGS-02 TaxID=2925411 RepID=UPI0020573B60|nr:hypothetical protein [Sulfurovum sp. XGS-02]UPT78146.1 hypothetical protein MN086_03125 [Sulfurovum sp. XGS-02]
MKKIVVLPLLITSLTSFGFSAEKYDTKAFRTVQKLCTSCHGTPFYMAKQIDEDDWDFYFETPGKLEKIHKNKPEALANLKNSLFQKRKKRLLKFFIDNSKFSGAVNGCDANFCGTVH